MTCVLVTGASGFVGRALVAALAREGHKVRATVRRPPQPDFPDGIEVTQHLDLAESFDWQSLLEGADKVIHLAGLAHTGRVAAPGLYDQVNHIATARLAAAAAQARIGHFVFASSIRAQSGPAAEHVISERDAATPIEPYGRSKLAAEHAVRAAGVPFTILRPVVLYGPGAKANVALLMRLAMSSCPLPLQNFANRRSLLGIDNLIAAVSFVLSAPAAIGETYIVADPGPALTLSEIVATLRRAQGRRPYLLPLPPRFVEIPLRILGRSDVWERLGGSLQVDAGKLLAAGWRPVHDTRSGLAAIVQLAGA